MAHAAGLALNDACIPQHNVDLIACVEPLSWNYSNLAATVTAELGLDESVEHLWVPAGGTSPQDLLHQIADRMANGELDVALICGAESMRTRRRYAKRQQTPEWPTRAEDVNPMRGQQPFSSALEIRHGLRAPIQVFPVFENAIRAAHGRSAETQSNIAAGILAKNARVAVDNPYAWFRDAPSQADIATISTDNRLIVAPYTKRMNAIMDVDQCAAVTVVSARWLNTHGDKLRAAAILGGAGMEEIWNPIERQSLAQCHAMERAISLALEKSATTAEEIDAMDLYSCFPSAIQFALQALGTDANDPRPFSLTGGLAYAGGPGNAYVLHSLATALTRIRKQPDARLLITGIGMANTKHAATVLTGADHVPPAATGQTTYREPLGETPREVDPAPSGPATVCGYTIEYGRDGSPENVIYILDLANGKRTIANSANPHAHDIELKQAEPTGRRGSVVAHHDSGQNIFEFT